MEPIPATAFSDDNPPPRVSLIGPKGCGKTIYRTYLHEKARVELPDFVRAALGIRQADLPEEGEVYSGEGGVWHWQTERTLGLRQAEGEFLPAIPATQALTRHKLTLPVLDDGSPLEGGLVYDFPGGFFEVPGSERLILDALRQSRMVVMMLPYWVLIPKALRRTPSPLAQARDRADGKDPVTVAKEHAQREGSLLAGALRWLELLRTARGHKEARPATVLVMLTMLHQEWGHELSASHPRGGEVAAQVRALRGLITQSLLNDEHDRGIASRKLPLFSPEFWLSLHGMGRAMRLRRALEELHAQVTRYTLAMEALCRALGRTEGDTLRVVSALRALENSSLALPYAFRYGAMNVVSERLSGRMPLATAAGEEAALTVGGPSVAPAEPTGFRRYFKMEPAAAMLPSLYLCGSLDER